MISHHSNPDVGFVLTDKSLALSLALIVWSLALALALQLESLALALALQLEALLTTLLFRQHIKMLIGLNWHRFVESSPMESPVVVLSPIRWWSLLHNTKSNCIDDDKATKAIQC